MKNLRTKIKQILSESAKKVINASLQDLIYDYFRNGDDSIKTLEIEDEKEKWFLDQLINICDELKQYNIDTSEILNTDNMGIKPDGSLGLFDIGFGNGFENFLEEPETYDIQEKKEQKKFDKPTLLDKIFQKFNIDSGNYLGAGEFGYAYDIGNNQILKISKDKSEAINSLKIKGKNLKHIANVYDVKILKHKEDTFYIIILEKLDTNKAHLIEEYIESLHSAVDEMRDKNYPISIIDSISTKHPLVAQFLNDMCHLGYEDTWEKWLENEQFKKSQQNGEYDWNDISEIAEFIKGSKSNKGFHKFADIPHYVESLVNSLI